jgi:hypothetical protein
MSDPTCDSRAAGTSKVGYLGDAMNPLQMLPFFLTWELEPDLPDRVLGEYVQILNELFFRWLGRSDDHGVCTPDVLRARYESLPAGSRARFLTTPTVAAALLHRGNPDPTSVVLCLTTSLTTEEGRIDALVSKTASRLESARPVPLSVEGIIVEAAEPTTEIIPLPTLVGQALHSSAEIEFILLRLSRCLGRIATVNPTTSITVRRALKVIRVRKDATDPFAFSSSSWPQVTGLAALVNAHRPEINDDWVTDALVHEAIHSLLNMAELGAPLYRSQAAANEYRAVSPWSGRVLKMHSYVHACFVWFGLWCFWSLAEESGALEASAAEPFRCRAHRGFQGGDLLTALGEGRQFLSDEVVDAIDTIQQIVSRAS